METTQPTYRASLLKSVVDELGERYPAAILARIDPARLAELDQASRASWYDARLMFELNGAIAAELGREAFVQFWIDFGRTATRVPLLKQMAEGAARMFGSGRGIAKLMPRSFEMVTRDVGSFSVESIEDNRAILKLTGFVFPEHFELFAQANRASTMGAMYLVGATPEANLSDLDAEAGSFTLELAWS